MKSEAQSGTNHRRVSAGIRVIRGFISDSRRAVALSQRVGVRISFGLRVSAFGFLLLFPWASMAQVKNPNPAPTPIEPAEGERQARALVANLLAQKPDANITNSGMVRIRDANGKRKALSANFGIVVTSTNYSTTYEVLATNGQPGSKLVIIHSDNQPNRYLLSDGSVSNAIPKELTGSQLMTPFAGSDFWVADLGLDFLHWPGQRILEKGMRKSVFCAVLLSSNSNSIPGGYSTVKSWIGTSHPDETVLVHAEAFDRAGKRLKQFDPEDLEKVNGAYQLQSMRMADDQRGSSTIIEFNLKPEVK
jgi:hypothetical protein